MRIKLSIFILLFALSNVAHAQNGCGATKNWTDASCQVIGSGALKPQWTVISRHGEYGQSETECNIPSAVSVADGLLSITTSASSYTCGDFNANGTVRTSAASWPYSTGDVQWNTFNFLYGTLEYRATYPPSSANPWPAHWLLAANCQNTNKYSGDTFSPCPDYNTTGYDEIDIQECYGGSCNANLHHNTTTQSCYYPSPNWDTNPHIITLNWTSSAVTIARDGTQVCSWTTNIPSQALFLIIQTQTGGIGGTPVNGLLPVTLTTDYVKVTANASTAGHSAGEVLFYDDFSPPAANPAQLGGAAKLSGAAAVK